MICGLPWLLALSALEGDAPVSWADRLSEATPALAASAVLLLCSAFFSSSETALFSLQPVDRQALPQPGRARVEDMLNHPRRTLATILIGNELVNVTLGTVTAGILLLIAPDKPWLNVLLLTPLLIVFGEVLPKVVALRQNRRLAGLVAIPLRPLSMAVAPLRWLLTRAAELALRATGGSAAPVQAQVREQQLRALIDRGHASGSIRPMEQQMLHKVFEFGDNAVSRLMTPRPDVFSISITTPWHDLLPAIREAGFSRVPVWQGNPDNIIGVLLVKNLLPAIHRARLAGDASMTARELKRCLIPSRFVPTTKRAQDMLQEFRAERFHMAIVVDEHGSVVGVLTLDDLLAELVGELLDETDDEDPAVSEVSPGVYRIAGWIDVDDFADRFDMDVPEGEYTTMGGLLTAVAGDLPEKGDEIDWQGWRFVVSGVEGRRITDLSMRRLAEAEATPSRIPVTPEDR